jgi:hypothetical protein
VAHESLGHIAAKKLARFRSAKAESPGTKTRPATRNANRLKMNAEGAVHPAERIRPMNGIGVPLMNQKGRERMPVRQIIAGVTSS